MSDVDEQIPQEHLQAQGPETTGDDVRTTHSANTSSSETPGRLEIPDALPVLPLRGGTVVFPLAVVPLSVG